MRTTRNKLISWMLVLVMALSLISPGASTEAKAAEAYDGYVYVTMERSTVGQGFAEEPMKVGYYEEENVEDIVKRAFGEDIIFTESSYGAYVTGFKDGGEPEGWTTDDIPTQIQEALGSAITADAKRIDATTLSQSDYVSSSGYTFLVDNVSANYGMSGIEYSKNEVADTYHNGSVIRVQFTMYYGDTNITPSEWGTPLIDYADKDALIQDVADYVGDKTGAAYEDAMAVLEDWDATEEEVTAAQNDLQAALSDTYESKHTAVVSYVKNNAEAPAFGDEWSILSVARSGVEDVKWYQTYLASVEETVTANESNVLSASRSTENSRLIIGLSAIGADPTDVAGYNMVAPLADYEYVEAQGLNGFVYALIALDCNNYEIPTVEEGKTQTTRDLLIEGILGKALDNGGWAYSGTTADPDMTGMALQALAPYYDENDSVKAAVDEALTALSEMQDEDGCFASWGSTNSMSCAQVVCALTALDIDVEEDARFIKNGKSVLDGMLSFCDVATGGYRYLMTEKTANAAATGQVAYALTAYDRWANGQNSLYDMTDASALSICKHAKTEKKNVKEATCTEEGYTGDVICTVCDETVEKGKKVAQTEVPAIGKKDESVTNPKDQIVIKRPDKTKFKKVVSKKKKQLTITWKKKSNITGYEIQVSTSSKFKAKATKTYKIKKANKTSKTIKKLKSKKKYYVRIRTYVTKKVDGTKVTKYSKWTKKSVRVK